MARTAIEFILGDNKRQLADFDPAMTLLDWLREDESRRGSKEGCAEGDCGACSVVLASLTPNGDIQYRAVNACIILMPMVDGKAILTVEDLTDADGVMHPAQQALVNTHGTQCGFCTPGFVMSMFAMHRDGAGRDRQSIDDRLAGNLCRCTGYGPIIDAASDMFDLVDNKAAPEQALIALLKTLPQDSVDAHGTDCDWAVPKTSDALATLLHNKPDSTLVAGATDVGLWVTKQHRNFNSLIFVGDVVDMQGLVDTGDHVEIGAGVTYTAAMHVVAALYPDMADMFRRIGSTQVRNSGTIGGNIANGSPIGDGPPALIAAGAKLVLRKGSDRRTIPLEDYFIDYGKQDRLPGEFVETIILPKPATNSDLRCYKISKRFDQDISALVAAINLRFDGDMVVDARIAYGGMAATPKRAKAVEAALTGKTLDDAAIETAMQMLDQDFTPISDMRASAGYRQQVAKNLLMKYFTEYHDGDTSSRLVGHKRLADNPANNPADEGAAA